MYKMQLK